MKKNFKKWKHLKFLRKNIWQQRQILKFNTLFWKRFRVTRQLYIFYKTPLRHIFNLSFVNFFHKPIENYRYWRWNSTLCLKKRYRRLLILRHCLLRRSQFKPLIPLRKAFIKCSFEKDYLHYLHYYIDTFLCKIGVCRTPLEAKKLLKLGVIKINNKIIYSPWRKLSHNDIISIMYNKMIFEQINKNFYFRNQFLVYNNFYSYTFSQTALVCIYHQPKFQWDFPFSLYCSYNIFKKFIKYGRQH